MEVLCTVSVLEMQQQINGTSKALMLKQEETLNVMQADWINERHFCHVWAWCVGGFVYVYGGVCRGLDPDLH